MVPKMFEPLRFDCIKDGISHTKDRSPWPYISTSDILYSKVYSGAFLLYYIYIKEGFKGVKLYRCVFVMSKLQFIITISPVTLSVQIQQTTNSWLFFFFFFFPRKQALAFQRNVFAWNVKAYFLGENKKKKFKMSSAEIFTQHAKRILKPSLPSRGSITDAFNNVLSRNPYEKRIHVYRLYLKSSRRHFTYFVSFLSSEIRTAFHTKPLAWNVIPIFLNYADVSKYFFLSCLKNQGLEILCKTIRFMKCQALFSERIKDRKKNMTACITTIYWQRNLYPSETVKGQTHYQHKTNTYHAMGRFSRWQIAIFLIFPGKQNFTFLANCLCLKCQILFCGKN